MKNDKLDLSIVLNLKENHQQQDVTSMQSNMSRNETNKRDILKPKLITASTTSNLLNSSSDWASDRSNAHSGSINTIPIDTHGKLSSSIPNRRRQTLVISLLIIALVVGLISLVSLLLLPSFVSHQISKVSFH